MLTYADFLRRYAVRPKANLTTAKAIPSQKLTLPINTLLHYTNASQIEMGIQGSNPLIQNVSEVIRVFHASENFGNNGGPITRNFNVKKEEGQYFKRQQRFKRIRNFERALTVKRDLMVVDYTFFNHMFKQRNSIWQTLYSHQNLVESYIHHINLVDDSRYQFIEIEMPDTLPELIRFKDLDLDAVTSTDLHHWTNGRQFWLATLFAFIENKGPLSEIKTPFNVNVVLRIFNEMVVLNLGNLKAHGEDDSKRAQMEFYKLLEHLMSLQPATNVETYASEEEIKETPTLIAARVEELGSIGKITAAEQKRLLTLDAKTPDIVDPYTGKSLKETTKLPKEAYEVTGELKSKVNDNVAPPDLQKSTVSNLTDKYVSEVMEADISNVLMSLNNAGYITTAVESKDVVDALNNYREFKLTVVPVEGKQTTVTMRIPNVDTDGTFIMDGVRATMDMQRVDK